MKFDTSTKVKFSIGADTQVTQAEYDPRPVQMIHPLVDPTTASQIMMNAVERMDHFVQQAKQSKNQLVLLSSVCV